MVFELAVERWLFCQEPEALWVAFELAEVLWLLFPLYMALFAGIMTWKVSKGDWKEIKV